MRQGFRPAPRFQPAWRPDLEGQAHAVQLLPPEYRQARSLGSHPHKLRRGKRVADETRTARKAASPVRRQPAAVFGVARYPGGPTAESEAAPMAVGPDCAEHHRL